MAKKRSCRRTADEDKIHEKAVKMRKMTDEQLVHYVEDRVEKAKSEGFNQGKKSSGGADINKFLKEISSIKGVGDATICKIADHFRKAVKLLGKEKKEKKKSQVDEAVELVFQDMENRMKTVMGTKVNISRKDKSKGKIEIEYYSEAELERLVELIESIQPV